MALSEVNDARPMVQRGFRAWMKSGGVFSMDPERPWRSYLKRSLIFTHHKKTSRLMYRHLGRDAALIRVKGRQWAESVVGKSCGRSLENIKAGDILSNVYDQVICGTEPRFDHIRACIPRADDEIEWVSYQRLLMPVTIKGGEPALICLSVTTPDVSIPTPVQNA
jgi:hypothetical protein